MRPCLPSASSVILIGSLAVGSAARASLALHDHGIFWGDEIHQSIEPAHRAVFGYGKPRRVASARPASAAGQVLIG
jgi:hypothetical protein